MTTTLGRWQSQNLFADVSGAELWPTPFKQKITEVAVKTLENGDSDLTLVVQACIILADRAELTGEQKASVLNSIKRRLEEASQSPEDVARMVPVNMSFQLFAYPFINLTSELSLVQLQLVFNSRSAGQDPTVDTPLIMQLLNVVSAIDTEKFCRPQVQTIFDASRDVFDIILAQRSKLLKILPGHLLPGHRLPGLPGQGFQVVRKWPDLTASINHPHGDSGLNILWGEHVPTQQDWMKYILLLHPAMQEIVSAEIAKRAEAVQPENPANPEGSGRL